MRTKEQFKEFLSKSFPDSEYKELFLYTCIQALDDERFCIWPASLKIHHTYQGGLLEHTMEVCELGFEMLASVVGRPISDPPNLNIFLVAAVWHDYSKIDDYNISINKPFPHYYLIRHVVKSYYEFMRRSEIWPEPIQYMRELIGHAMLAHHGRKEWGSPIEPQTREAWALHLADMASVQVVEQK